MGPGGSLERILELLQSRFGNRLRLEKFRVDLKNRRRGRNETLQDLYLDLCRLRANAFGDDPNDRYPEVYFRNIFVDALNDKELRRAVLVQNPLTMEAAYNVATQLEAIDAYGTPVRRTSPVKTKVRNVGHEPKDSAYSHSGNADTVAMAKRLEELEGAMLKMQQQATNFPRGPMYEMAGPPVQNPRPARPVGPSHGGEPIRNTRDDRAPPSRADRVPASGKCYTCGESGHYSRDCNLPRRPYPYDSGTGRGTHSVRPRFNQSGTDPKGPGTARGLSSPAKIRREAYLEIFFGGRTVHALLDSGCEQSVIGRKLIRNVPLEPTTETLSTADGTDLPLLGETKIYFTVAGVPTECRVVVTDAISELILGIEWLQTNQCVWDFGSNSFSIEGTLSKLRCRRAQKAVRRILVKEEIEVPGFHASEVPVRVVRTSLTDPQGDWGMENGTRKTNLVVANGIYDSYDLESVCQVINMSDSVIRLKRGSEIGRAEPVEIVVEQDSPRYTEVNEFSEPEGCPLDLRVLSNRNPGSVGSAGSEESKLGSLCTDSKEPRSRRSHLNVARHDGRDRYGFN